MVDIQRTIKKKERGKQSGVRWNAGVDGKVRLEYVRQPRGHAEQLIGGNALLKQAQLDGENPLTAQRRKRKTPHFLKSKGGTDGASAVLSTFHPGRRNAVVEESQEGKHAFKDLEPPGDKIKS